VPTFVNGGKLMQTALRRHQMASVSDVR